MEMTWQEKEAFTEAMNAAIDKLVETREPVEIEYGDQLKFIDARYIMSLQVQRKLKWKGVGYSAKIPGKLRIYFKESSDQA